jgi:beta-lactamase regulating signal transducer with metallopeptidase domain
MGEALFDHLWQSTLCVVAAGLLTLAFRKDRASVRFLIWFAASAKFLVPFSSLVWLGGLLGSTASAMLHVSPRFAAAMERLASPTTTLMNNLGTTSLAHGSGPSFRSSWTIAVLIWALGVIFLIFRRTLQWLQLHAITRESTPLDIDSPIPVRETTSNLEPGVFGIVSPTVLVPAGIASQLAEEQLNAILAHELCHWRRRDNLTAAIHTLVETLVWFHPIVWWLGTQMVAERERACDEAVIQSGKNRQMYAEGLLKVCRMYLATPGWSAGVSGGVLRKRIEEIMQNPVLTRLSLAKKSLLTVAASLVIVVPIAAGLWHGPGVALAAEANSIQDVHYINNEWKFELDLPTHWMPLPSRSTPDLLPGHAKSFGTSDSTNRLLTVLRHTYDPSKEKFKTILFKTILESAQQDMANMGFVHFVPGASITIGSKPAISLDFERAPRNGEGVWYCRNYYILGTRGAYILQFGARNITAAQRDAVFKVYDRMAKSFVFEDL